MSIKVNVGGKIFETTISTLKKINYFKYLLEDTDYDNTQIIFVDRSAHIFKHVLALAINENYNYPYKYKDELDFYDVSYDVNNLRNPLQELKDKINILETQINVLKKCKFKNCDKILKSNDHFCGYHVLLANKCIHSNNGYICENKCDNSKNKFVCRLHEYLYL